MRFLTKRSGHVEFSKNVNCIIIPLFYIGTPCICYREPRESRISFHFIPIIRLLELQLFHYKGKEISSLLQFKL